MELTIPYIYLLVLVLLGFAGLGLRRGWMREGFQLVGILASWLITAKLGTNILHLVNRLARSVLFVFQGGLDSEDPASLVRRLNKVQIVDPMQPEIPLVILFCVLVAATYTLTTRYVKPSRSIPSKAAGALLAMINGYLIAFVALQEPSLRAKLVISADIPALPSFNGHIDELIGQYAAFALVTIVGIIIVIALLSSIRSARRRAGQGWAERRRG